jgi:TonB family protein
MRHRRIVAWSIGEALLLLSLGGIAAAQDSLVTIKTLYASAAYEEALTAIDRLRSAGPAASDSRSLDQYRAFCLLALGREAEANKALEDLVTADPLFTPDPSELSPRVLALLHGVRRRLLPALAQQKYAMAKATYDRKEYAAAAEQFARVVSLLDDADMDQKTAGLSDLRTLAGGFLDLAKGAAAPPKAPQPASEPAPAPPPAPPTPSVKAVYDASDPQVTPPVVQRQDIPAWPLSQRAFTSAPIRPGIIEIVIDETGRVERAVLRQSMNPVYDALLLSAATNWRYKPALRDGSPVKYRKLIQITIQPSE